MLLFADAPEADAAAMERLFSRFEAFKLPKFVEEAEEEVADEEARLSLVLVRMELLEPLLVLDGIETYFI